jgi:hypothetical protein
LQDAFLQCRGAINRAPTTILVGAHDEMTPAYFQMVKKSGFLGQPNQTFASETAVAMMLSTEKTEKSLCKIENLEKFYGNQLDTQYSILDTKPDFIMVGTNGVAKNDNDYFENCARLFPNIPLLQYKNIFGESYTAPAFGVYAVALCLQRGKIPEFLKAPLNPPSGGRQSPPEEDLGGFKSILCYNNFENKNHTFVLLSCV